MEIDILLDISGNINKINAAILLAGGKEGETEAPNKERKEGTREGRREGKKEVTKKGEKEGWKEERNERTNMGTKEEIRVSSVSRVFFVLIRQIYVSCFVRNYRI